MSPKHPGGPVHLLDVAGTIKPDTLIDVRKILDGVRCIVRIGNGAGAHISLHVDREQLIRLRDALDAALDRPTEVAR